MKPTNKHTEQCTEYNERDPKGRCFCSQPSSPNEFQDIVDTLTAFLDQHGRDELESAVEFTIHAYEDDEE